MLGKSLYEDAILSKYNSIKNELNTVYYHITASQHKYVLEANVTGINTAKNQQNYFSTMMITEKDFQDSKMTCKMTNLQVTMN